MDTFKRQDNDTLKKLCPPENNCDVLIVLYNLTNKFQPLNLSVNEVAKSFIQNNYNDWFADWHLRSFKIEKILPMLKYHPNFRIWSPYMREGLEKRRWSEGSILQVYRKMCRILRISMKKLRIHLEHSFLTLLNC